MTEIERKKEYDKAYKKKNKEKVKAWSRSYYLANKEKVAKKQKIRKSKNTLEYSIVYCIPNYDGIGGNYCGVTNNIKSRMYNHKAAGRLNIKDWFILDIKTDRFEAEKSERQFHSNGYHGTREAYKLITNNKLN
jgi:hypothetical protein